MISGCHDPLRHERVGFQPPFYIGAGEAMSDDRAAPGHR
jgi:hypothetical protein